MGATPHVFASPNVHQFTLDDGVEVFGELQEGDTIFTRGSEEIREGTKAVTDLQLR